MTQLSSWQRTIFINVPEGPLMTCEQLCKLTKVMADRECWHSRKAAYHARVHSAGLIASTYHPIGDGLHVKIGLALLQRNNADLPFLQLKGHCIQKGEERETHESIRPTKTWPAKYKMNNIAEIFS